MNTLAKIFKSLSDETRLKVLGLLFEKGELCVCDLMETLQISQSKASRHLRYLVNAGLLKDRREAVWVYYRINDTPSNKEREILDALRVILTHNMPPSLFDALKEWQVRKKCQKD
jgi:ArsR family transcriptional regulator